MKPRPRRLLRMRLSGLPNQCKRANPKWTTARRKHLLKLPWTIRKWTLQPCSAMEWPRVSTQDTKR